MVELMWRLRWLQTFSLSSPPTPLNALTNLLSLWVRWGWHLASYSEIQCSAIWQSPFEQKSKGSELPDKGSWRREWRSFLPGFQKGSIGCNSCQWLRTKSYCCCSSTNHHLQRMRNKIPMTNRKATWRTMNMANWCVAYWLTYWILEHELQCSVAITVTCVLESI